MLIAAIAIFILYFIIKDSNLQSAIRNPIIVGFALETDGIIKNAKKKLREKNLDFIVANSINGFGSNQNKVTIIDKKGNLYDIPQMSKDGVAEIILDKIVK